MLRVGHQRCLTYVFVLLGGRMSSFITNIGGCFFPADASTQHGSMPFSIFWNDSTPKQRPFIRRTAFGRSRKWRHYFVIFSQPSFHKNASIASSIFTHWKVQRLFIDLVWPCYACLKWISIHQVQQQIMLMAQVKY